MRGAYLLALVVALAGCGRDAPKSGASGSDVTGSAASLGATGIRFLGEGDSAGFARATSPRELSFPGDHGSHSDFRTEWWYFTGNLESAAGAHFGFELTFFRVALGPEGRARDSAWGANQVWMAHLAVTDVAHGRFSTAERLARGSLGLAGTEPVPFHVWVKDWAVEGLADASSVDLDLAARDGEMALALHLKSLKPPVAQGDRGLDAKGPELGNASYYYSFTRVAATGTISLGGVSTAVSGSAWIDREWGTSALSGGVIGWDWFALQLSDDRELMYYRLRQPNGDPSPFSSGSIVTADGVSRRLGADDVRLTATGLWRSKRTGIRYPVAWRLEIPSEDVTLEITPYLENQEVDLSVRYWEGAVHATGSDGTSELTGQGYLELAGY